MLLSGRRKKSKTSDECVLHRQISQAKLQDLPLFNFNELATATNSFHNSNKLGQGGFGPVYRVKPCLYNLFALKPTNKW